MAAANSLTLLLLRPMVLSLGLADGSTYRSSGSSTGGSTAATTTPTGDICCWDAAAAIEALRVDGRDGDVDCDADAVAEAVDVDGADDVDAAIVGRSIVTCFAVCAFLCCRKGRSILCFDCCGDLCCGSVNLIGAGITAAFVSFRAGYPVAGGYKYE